MFLRTVSQPSSARAERIRAGVGSPAMEALLKASNDYEGIDQELSSIEEDIRDKTLEVEELQKEIATLQAEETVLKKKLDDVYDAYHRAADANSEAGEPEGYAIETTSAYAEEEGHESAY